MDDRVCGYENPVYLWQYSIVVKNMGSQFESWLCHSIGCVTLYKLLNLSVTDSALVKGETKITPTWLDCYKD